MEHLCHGHLYNYKRPNYTPDRLETRSSLWSETQGCSLAGTEHTAAGAAQRRPGIRGSTYDSILAQINACGAYKQQQKNTMVP